MANKKINQLVSKTAILSTDLFGIGDATTGQLFKKTIAELQAAIGGAVISVNGLVGTVVLDTDDIQELATPTNKYFTDARARGAISLTVTGNSGASTYSSGTGVLNVPTYTLAGLGGITATFLSGTSGISYNSTTGVISYSGTVYTDSSIRALLSGGTGITYNSSTGAISYSGTVYTDSSVRALISLTTTGTSGASTYNNTTGVINVPNYTLAGLGGISLTSLSGGTGITYNNTTGAISYSGTVYTDASIRALISATGSVSYNNTTGVISLTSGNLTEATSSVLTITGGTGAVLGSGTSIQVKQASSTVSGFLSSTDFNTFNGKASALSGTTGYHAKFTSSTAIGDSLIYDNGTSVGIGTASPTSSSSFQRFLHIAGGASLNSALCLSGQNLAGQGTIGYDSNVLYIDALGAATGANNAITFNTTSVNSSNTRVERMRITSAGIIQTSGDISLMNPTGDISLRIKDSLGNSDRVLTRQITTNNVYIGDIDANGGAAIIRSNGNDSITITSAGNVGIGTSSPNDKLVVFGASIATNQNNGNIGIYSTDSYGSNIGGSIALGGYYNGSNYIGFGSIHGKKDNGTADNAYGYLAFLTRGSDGSVVRMNIASTGNILMGTSTDNGERLYVSGSIRATGSITANSDISLKKNLLKIKNALEKVEQINGYTYELKEDDSKRHAGVIAQEIQTVLPEIVNTGNDGLMGVEYGNISALLIEAIKEQQTQIKELKALLNK